MPKCYSYMRFSTPEQNKGDSERRQADLIKQAEEYAKKLGYELDNSLRIDRGISAFKGEHKTKGALSKFLKLIVGGKIEKGSILLVEHLDRLSREHIMDALDLFTSIINAGIEVHTLSDKKIYTRERINENFTDLIMSIVYMAKAHDESKTKSKRLKAAWENKRKNVNEKKLTGRCPAWLELSTDKKKFIPIKDRIKVINKIFKMKMDGKGAEWIEKELNSKPISWIPKNGWQKSYINKIIRNPAVIGEYQPHKMINGKRTPIEQTIKDYFPAVISEEIFYKIQNLIKLNSHYGGRNGKVSNLFSHICKCGYCGSSMHFINKGQPPKGGRYLVCDKAKRGMGCSYHAIRYDDFEKIILSFCKGLNIDDILPENELKESQLSHHKDKLTVIEAKHERVINEIENLTDSIANTKSKEVRSHLEESLSLKLSVRETLLSDKAVIQSKIKQIDEAEQCTIQNILSIKEFCESKDIECIDIRLKLRDKLRQLIKRIDIFPVGLIKIMTPEVMSKIIDFRKKKYPKAKDSAFKQFEKYLRANFETVEERVFKIIFTNGNKRVIEPRAKNKIISDMDLEAGVLKSCSSGENGETIYKTNYRDENLKQVEEVRVTDKNEEVIFKKKKERWYDDKSKKYIEEIWVAKNGGKYKLHDRKTEDLNDLKKELEKLKKRD